MPTLMRLLVVLLAGTSLRAGAAGLGIIVNDQDGAPVADAVTVLRPVGHSSPPVAAGTVAVIDQRDLRFVPRVLPVQVGTQVEFPNSDQVRHHVYSFSPAKTFELRLYKAKPAAPVVFDKAGTVTLGCNIHDWMLGYVYVVDTPWFAKSGADGRATLVDVPPGDYRLEVWHPRLLAPPSGDGELVQVRDGAPVRVVSLALKPPEPEPEPPTELEQKFRQYQKKHADGA